METAESARIKQDYQGRCVSGSNASNNKSISVVVFLFAQYVILFITQNQDTSNIILVSVLF